MERPINNIGRGNASLRPNSIEITSAQAKILADEFIDSAPEDAMSTDEYEWQFRFLTRQELMATGLLDGFDEHVRNIGLDITWSYMSRPVVVSVGDGERYQVAIWDGVHRIMTALATGACGLPAAFGTKKIFQPTKGSLSWSN